VLPTNLRIQIVSPGKWILHPPPSRVVVTGVGPIGIDAITIKKDELMNGYLNLKDYFRTVSPGKNTISFDFPVWLPEEKKTVTIRKTLDLELTAEQIASFSDGASR
jgi:hypothetical protein